MTGDWADEVGARLLDTKHGEGMAYRSLTSTLRKAKADGVREAAALVRSNGQDGLAVELECLADRVEAK